MTLDELNEAAATFVGDQMQTPPMVSAVKKDGVPLYKLARKGIEVEREAAPDPHLQLSLHELRGTDRALSPRLHQGNLRALASPMNSAKSSAAARTLPRLRRVTSGKFDVSEAMPLEAVLKLSERELEKRVIPFLKLASG